MFKKKLVGFVFVLVALVGSISLPSSAFAASRTSCVNKVTQTPYGPATVTCASYGNVTTYDTKLLLQRHDLKQVVKHIRVQKNSKGIQPNASLTGGADFAYYDLALNWVYSNQTNAFICGYAITDIASQTGPADGNIQAEAFVTIGGQQIQFWNYEADWVNSAADESACKTFGSGTPWLVEGGAAAKWPDGSVASTNNNRVYDTEP